MNDTDSNSPAAFSESHERRIILLLCCLAAVHGFVFSAAAPFFSNVDEQIHLDLAIKYSQGHLPRALEFVSDETAPYVTIYGAHEYLWPSNDFPTAQFPPPWTQPMEKIAAGLQRTEAEWKAVKNYEASQPPLYYTLAGGWWQLGKTLGFQGGHLLYWLRFLNLFFVAGLVWLGYIAARLVFPERPFLRLGLILAQNLSREKHRVQ